MEKTKILITGAEGFVGKNLRETLILKGKTVLSFDKENSKEELADMVNRAQAIVHLAGVNRPVDVSEYNENSSFTAEIIALIKKTGRKIPLVVSSSTQSDLDNPYGISKKNAEDMLFKFEKESENPVFVFRFPNLFGKWCRPNYNSVVATFCYNIANSLPISISDFNKEVSLMYIDDVVSSIIKAIDGEIGTKDGFCVTEPVYTVTLGKLAATISDFKKSRENLIVPDFSDKFTEALYSTYTSYFAEDDFAYPLDMKKDDRGWLAEVIKSNQFGQIFISKSKPGITRGNHWHHTKTEKFLVVAGKALITFRHISSQHVIEYEVCGEELKVVDIPVGYTHAIKNIGDTECITVFWTPQLFNADFPDTYFLEVGSNE